MITRAWKVILRARQASANDDIIDRWLDQFECRIAHRLATQTTTFKTFFARRLPNHSLSEISGTVCVSSWSSVTTLCSAVVTMVNAHAPRSWFCWFVTNRATATALTSRRDFEFSYHLPVLRVSSSCSFLLQYFAFLLVIHHMMHHAWRSDSDSERILLISTCWCSWTQVKNMPSLIYEDYSSASKSDQLTNSRLETCRQHTIKFCESWVNMIGCYNPSVGCTHQRSGTCNVAEVWSMIHCCLLLAEHEFIIAFSTNLV